MADDKKVEKKPKSNAKKSTDRYTVEEALKMTRGDFSAHKKLY